MLMAQTMPTALTPMTVILLWGFLVVFLKNIHNQLILENCHTGLRTKKHGMWASVACGIGSGLGGS